MEFEISLRIKVDPDANFLETFGNNSDVIMELVQASLYDIDDIIIEECEVRRDK
jgi:hypothetical protein|tara:strand:+ start:493 stop:654 length:162 start_codon:yes stop_codon:yes gene_type:complete